MLRPTPDRSPVRSSTLRANSSTSPSTSRLASPTSGVEQTTGLLPNHDGSSPLAARPQSSSPTWPSPTSAKSQASGGHGSSCPAHCREALRRSGRLVTGAQVVGKNASQQRPRWRLPDPPRDSNQLCVLWRHARRDAAHQHSMTRTTGVRDAERFGLNGARHNSANVRSSPASLSRSRNLGSRQRCARNRRVGHRWSSDLARQNGPRERPFPSIWAGGAQ
jgi:hypothetical protein